MTETEINDIIGKIDELQTYKMCEGDWSLIYKREVIEILNKHLKG